jgi:LuxR family maltose regulon positive regulatory protein
LFLDPLTPRELEILRQMSAGLTNQEIADQLVISVSTVKKHITHIYNKLGASDRIKAINRARELDLLPYSTP